MFQFSHINLHIYPISYIKISPLLFAYSQSFSMLMIFEQISSLYALAYSLLDNKVKLKTNEYIIL